jgi:hypothetical protein
MSNKIWASKSQSVFINQKMIKKMQYKRIGRACKKLWAELTEEEKAKKLENYMKGRQSLEYKEKAAKYVSAVWHKRNDDEKKNDAIPFCVLQWKGTAEIVRGETNEGKKKIHGN